MVRYLPAKKSFLFSAETQGRLFFHREYWAGFCEKFWNGKGQREYFVLFDSDCIIPPQYLSVLQSAIKNRNLDAHGARMMPVWNFQVSRKQLTIA